MPPATGIILVLLLGLVGACWGVLTQFERAGELQAILDQRDTRITELSRDLEQEVQRAEDLDKNLQQRESALAKIRARSDKVREVIRVVREKVPDLDACMDMRLPDAVFDGVPIEPAGSDQDREKVSAGASVDGLRDATGAGANTRQHLRTLGSSAGEVGSLQRGQGRAETVAEGVS